MKSEFGKGFVYNLFLFAKHHDREMYKKDDSSRDYMMWFDGASDHFYDLKIPKKFENTEIGKLARWIKNTSLSYRTWENQPSNEQFDEIFIKCEKLMMLIDEAFGLKPIKADWN